jgi:hypothetical protein
MEKMSTLLVKVCHEKRKSKDVKLHSTPGIVHMPRGAEKKPEGKMSFSVPFSDPRGSLRTGVGVEPVAGLRAYACFG